jgi:sialate O-acetylesterase
MTSALRNRLLCCLFATMTVWTAGLVAAAPRAAKASTTTTSQELRLAAVFTDNMVLQRDMKVPVWGWAPAGQQITVSIAGSSAKAKADRSGRWMVKLPQQPAGGPHEMRVSGGGEITLRNILFGDVWICSGQSNMAFAVNRSTDAQKVIEESTSTQIRLFTVDRAMSREPLADVGKHQDWVEAGPANRGSFSAVAYYFGRELQAKLGVPIGLIHTSWGGTPVQSWTSVEGLAGLPFMRGPLREQAEMEKASEDKQKSELQRLTKKWFADIDKRDPGTTAGARKGWADPGLKTTDWKTMELPALWESAGLPKLNGVVWFRKEIDVPASMADKRALLSLGNVDNTGQTYVNGQLVGSAAGAAQIRNLKLPASLLKPGRNVIAVRVLDEAGAGGFAGQPSDMKIEFLDKSETKTIVLSGEWQYKVGLSGISRRPTDRAGTRRLGGLYNAMIAPLIPYGIKGAIWYQGEANAGSAYDYRSQFPAMIRDWRQRWGEGDFPFLFVQLANYMARLDQPAESNWAELREAQLMTLSLPNTGMAVAIDIGEGKDIHPKNKLDVGRRLALAARRIAHGEKDLVYSGPVYRKGSMKVEGDKARLRFDHVGGGLVAKGGDLKGFAVAGKDRKFEWATARIDGDSVIVSSDRVKEPVAVRYGWANNPECNLYNKEDLPATPFRTDDWPGVTE